LQKDAMASGERIAANRGSQYHGCMNLGFPEMIFLFLLALIIFGPKKMPEIGRQIGKALNEFKRASNEFKTQIEHEVNQMEMENEPKILPPAEPPRGTLAALPLQPEPVTVPVTETEPPHAVNAPDA
jgi:TatA/E family protein of Tat protein translocase